MTEKLKQKNVNKVLVIGAGTMGHGIAQVFARKGFSVSIFDQDPEALARCRAAITTELDFLVAEKAISAEVRDQTTNNIIDVTELELVAREADFVIEVIVEDLQVKRELFGKLDKMCLPQTVLASNTSGISISSIAEATTRPGKVIGMHWWNPPYLVPVIEIIRGKETSDQTLELVKEITLILDKKPVVVNKDIPGFLGNRMQYALMREAIHMLEEGVASAEDIDLMVKAGFGFKFPVMGPLETIDMAGFDIYQKVSGYLYQNLCNSSEPQKLITDKVAKGEKGIKSGIGFYHYDSEEFLELIKTRNRKLLALLGEMGHKI